MFCQAAKAQLKQAERQIVQIEAAIHTLIEADATLQARYQIILSIPGMGPVSSFTCVVEMPELGSADAKQIASLARSGAGLAPIARDSGAVRGKRFIRGGRKPIARIDKPCRLK